ncbi:LacI family DNA-binding transcriptional regulator [Microbacterium sp. 3J1]|uniref:LacI family DNA-binding transcriptional regulator n=1 Tax=Microbacterium sp. 3J1 TaxID=861269 RepID=UPI000B88ABCE|nr:LacI family DNA-binding transcriptional regulator [Microbacterium sp. 3J1]
MPSQEPSKPTLSEVSERAGVGRSSAARVLGGYGSVSAYTRDRVLAAAAELGYETNELARSMSTGVTKTIGVIVADLANPYFAGVLRGVSDTTRAAGYGTIVISTDEDQKREDEAVRLLTAKRVDGIIVAPAGGRQADASALRSAIERGTPLVQIDRTVDGLDADAVVLDNRDAAREATDYLLAAGHRRIALAWGPAVPTEQASVADLALAARTTEITSVGERYLGYADAFADAGVAVDPLLVMTGEQTAEGVRDFLAGVLGTDGATAVIATEQDAVIASLGEARARGLRIPQDLSIVSFDDSPWAEVHEPAITTVRQPLRALGENAANLLLARIAGEAPGPTVTHLSSEFVDRASVRRVKRGGR